jgi:hypothetical protein
MGFFDSVLGPLFGSTRLRRPDIDHLFTLTTAEPSLDAAELAPGGRAAVCLQPVEGAAFAAVDHELRELVALACRGNDFHGQVAVSRDDLGYVWVVFTDPDLGESVNLVHLAGSTLQEHGYGEQLLAAVFRFRQTGDDAPCLLIYNYKRGSFYPFVPTGGRARDNAAEFRIGSALGRILPVEKDVTRWFPLWGAPV